jgi:hypothetical protein
MSGDASDFNNIETRAVIKIFFFLQSKDCFFPGRAKDLSAPPLTKDYRKVVLNSTLLHRTRHGTGDLILLE